MNRRSFFVRAGLLAGLGIIKPKKLLAFLPKKRKIVPVKETYGSVRISKRRFQKAHGIAAYDEVLKKFYLPAIKKQLNQPTMLSKLLKH